MKYGKMVLIAYIEWLINELMMTANKIEYKNARLALHIF